MKFVIHYIIGPLITSALLGLAWASYYDVGLYVEFSSTAREGTYTLVRLVSAALIGSIIGAIMTIAQASDSARDADDEKCKDALESIADDVASLKSRGKVLAVVLLFGLAVFIFFGILDGIAEYVADRDA